MFAVIQTGGKQYKVKAGDELQVELIPVGKVKTVKFDRVLLISKDARDAASGGNGQGSVEIGKPFVKGAYCEAEVLREVKAPKVISFKYIRREKSATKIGHRQKYLKVKIKSIHI